MPLSFKCPACDHDLQAPDAAAGRAGECKFCHVRIVAPAAPGKPAGLADPSPDVLVAQATGRTHETGSAPGPAADPFPPAGTPYEPLRPAQMARKPAAMDFGDLMKRLIAFIVDNILLAIAVDVFIIVALAPLLHRSPMELVYSTRVSTSLFMVTEWFYFTLMESSPLGATLGKLALGLRVADTYGDRLTFWRAGVRSAAKWISQWTFLLGYVMAMFNNRSQTLHDVIAGTVVLER